ncbi:hypothetical protein GOBAR_AA37134 [Gossypium barbadense]|uniref:Uncharacterized protein n=1 Tax=Gossypium barbadense TaxID=3634 RepID=A0A2P5VXL8_GOSBA|nr:hypothetical protein GOBAR_AA37134 [Gossypium barbadense]
MSKNLSHGAVARRASIDSASWTFSSAAQSMQRPTLEVGNGCRTSVVGPEKDVALFHFFEVGTAAFLPFGFVMMSAMKILNY